MLYEVITITKGRGRRPQDFLQQRQQIKMAACPFCKGNEDKTPPEIYAHRPNGSKPNQDGWQVRVIPNKFPALRIEGELENRAEGLYDRMNGIGAHEVIIEHPEHNRTMADLSTEELAEVLKAYRVRMLDLVITSYSIHYTKLYESMEILCTRPPKHCFR